MLPSISSFVILSHLSFLPSHFHFLSLSLSLLFLSLPLHVSLHCFALFCSLPPFLSLPLFSSVSPSISLPSLSLSSSQLLNHFCDTGSPPPGWVVSLRNDFNPLPQAQKGLSVMLITHTHTQRSERRGSNVTQAQSPSLSQSQPQLRAGNIKPFLSTQKVYHVQISVDQTGGILPLTGMNWFKIKTSI